jgi:hypothetical protein
MDLAHSVGPAADERQLMSDFGHGNNRSLACRPECTEGSEARIVCEDDDFACHRWRARPIDEMQVPLIQESP